MHKPSTDGPRKILMVKFEELPEWNDLLDRLGERYRVKSNYWAEMNPFRAGNGPLFNVKDSNWADINPAKTMKEMESIVGDYDYIIFALSCQDLEKGGQSLIEELIHQIAIVKTILSVYSPIVLVESTCAKKVSHIKEYNVRVVPFEKHFFATHLDIENLIEKDPGPYIPRQHVQKGMGSQLKDSEVKAAALITIPFFLLAIALISILLTRSGDTYGDDNEDEYLIPNDQQDDSESQNNDSEVDYIACEIDTEKGIELPDVIVCTQSGTIELSSSVEFWHNEIRYIKLDPGVSAVVHYEQGIVFDTFNKDFLGSGTFKLNPEYAHYGIDLIEFRFTEDGQKAYLINSKNLAATVVYTK